jgi:hypothetical protein
MPNVAEMPNSAFRMLTEKNNFLTDKDHYSYCKVCRKKAYEGPVDTSLQEEQMIKPCLTLFYSRYTLTLTSVPHPLHIICQLPLHLSARSDVFSGDPSS